MTSQPPSDSEQWSDLKPPAAVTDKVSADHEPGMSATSTDDIDTTVVTVEDVRKTYCRNLRRSLWYGVQDIYRELTFRGSYSGALRTDEFVAVDGASFSLSPGDCVALLGPNGAGKSTMLKMMNGILRPNAGSIRIRGKVSALIELGTGFNPILSGRENVFINAAVLGFSREETEERLDEILEFSEIGEFIDAPVQSYSSGMRVRLGFAVASHLAPDLLLIDEVLAVGDLAFRLKCYEHLKTRVEQGMTVVLVSHIVAMMPRFCNRAIVFDQGRIVFDGEIMEGITEYQKVLGIEKAKRAEASAMESDEGVQLQSDPTSAGSAHVAVTEARTFNKDRVAAETFETNDAVTLELDLESKESISGCSLVVTLESAQSGDVAVMASPRSQFRFDLDANRKRTVVLYMKEVPLVDGAYSFSVTVYGNNGKQVLERAMALGYFQIRNQQTRPYIKGIMVTEHQWEIKTP